MSTQTEDTNSTPHLKAAVRALIEQAKADLERIEGEWGSGLSYERMLARGDDDARTIDAAERAINALPPVEAQQPATVTDADIEVGRLAALRTREFQAGFAFGIPADARDSFLRAIVGAVLNSQAAR